MWLRKNIRWYWSLGSEFKPSLLVLTTQQMKEETMIKNILNFLDYVLFLGLFYIIYLGLKHADQINQLIIELKGGL